MNKRTLKSERILMSISLPFEQWLGHIRTHSKFYRKYLRHLPAHNCALEDVPIVEVADYWAGSHDLDNWDVLTDKVEDALIYKTEIGRASWRERVCQYV